MTEPLVEWASFSKKKADKIQIMTYSFIMGSCAMGILYEKTECNKLTY